MTPSKDLFELVKSMTSAEKGYLKKRALAFKGNAQNMLLFELIEQQKEYNEESILNKLNSTRKNSFAVAKNYLYQFVLETLEDYHKNSLNRKVRGLLNSVELLSNKGLISQAVKANEKAKHIAQKFQLKNFLLEIADWEIQFLMNKNQTKTIFKEIQNLNDEFFGYLKSIETSAKAKYTFNYVRNKHLIIGMARNTSVLTDIEALSGLIVKNKSGFKNDFIVQYYYLFTSAVYAFTNNDFKTAYDYSLRVEQLWFKFPHMKKLYPDLFMYFITRKSLFEERLGLMDNIFKNIEMGRKFITGNLSVDHKIKSSFYNFNLGMCNQYAQYQRSSKVIDEINLYRKTLQSQRFVDYDEQLYIVTAADFYFETGDYKKANSLLNQIFDFKMRYREDIYCFTFIKSILIHFELKHYDLLEYKIKTTLAFLKKQKRLFKTEKLVLDFIRKQIKNSTIVKADYRKLKNQLEEALTDPLEKNILNYFDFLIWVDSKIENKSFKETKKKKLML